MRRFLRWGILPVVALLVAGNAGAQTARSPARILVGFPPGGNVDLLARLFAEPLSEAMGRTFVVENRPGAVGQIAAEVVKASAPDGNTLLLAPDASVVIRPQTLKKPTFDPLVDFLPVAHTGNWAMALGVNAQLPVKDLHEFAGWAKGNPEKASFASAGAGGSTHFYGLLLAQALGIELRHVPYKGSGPAVADLAAGHVAAAVQPLGTMLAQTKAGKVKVLAISSAQRTSAGPEIPTFAELNYPSLTAEGWFGIFAPAGTPREVVTRLNAAVNEAMRTPVVRERMRNLDLEVREMTPAEFAALVRADVARWAPVIKTSGFNGDSQ